VIKEPGDVKEENGTDHTRASGFLDLVPEEACSVRGRMAGMGKLHGGEGVMVEGIRGEAVGNHFLKELAEAFKKGNGAVGFGHSIVWFVGLGNDDHLSNRPGMMTKFQGPMEDGEEVRGVGRKAPFEEVVGDAQWSGG